MKLIRILLNFFQTQPNRAAWIIFILSLVITQGIAYRIFIVEKENEFLQVKQEVMHIKNELQNVFNQGRNTSRILAFLIERDQLGDSFEKVSEELISQSEFVDALQLVKDNTIVNTYPLKGNEKTIGYKVLNDSVHRQEAMKALKRRRLYFEGPIKLKQGGEGIVGRLPVYKNGQLWGFSVVIIRKETLLKAIRTDSTGVNGPYVYQMVESEKNNGILNKLFTNQKDFDKGVFHREYLASGDWYIYAKLREPHYLQRTLQFSFLGLLLSGLLTFFMRYLFSQPQKLRLLVAEKTKTLNNLNQELESRAEELTLSNAALEQFAYTVSHDLQEPLRMVSSFLKQIDKKYAHFLDERGKQYIYFAVDGASRMRTIILDVLEFSTVGKYNEKAEAINLNLLLDEVCLMQRKVIEKKHAHIHYGVLPEIVSYHTPLQRVFLNLIGNALKYCEVGVKPVIEVSVVRQNEEWLFSVKDNGIGIDKEYAEKVFVLFQRLHSKDQYSGSGVGLTIVKKIIDSLDGKVWVESEKNRGSTFYFTLPFKISLTDTIHYEN